MKNLHMDQYPLILFDRNLDQYTRNAHVTKQLVSELEALRMRIIDVKTPDDLVSTVRFTPHASSVLLDWDSIDHSEQDIQFYLNEIYHANNGIPVFILTEKHEIDQSIATSFPNIKGYFWKYDETADFIAARIKKQCTEYLWSLLPPFCTALVKYCNESNYAWHTPGHMGGVAFLKSPTGRLFYNFYGENTFRSDLSISVPELGSLLDHSGVIGEAERYCATTFGADRSYFVTNGTSTSNKIVMMGVASAGNIALVDRNCHKSLQHAMTLANVIPIYLKPTRNAYGIIGGIPLSEFSPDAIQDKIQQCPLIEEKSSQVDIVVITNSTYDGLVYNVDHLKDRLAKSQINVLHFDEAWFPYAHFHPIYQGKYAMTAHQTKTHPTVFSTQSTHKLLAAFSQASMIHLKQGHHRINDALFNETFMMHTSTSPQYNVIASLDISTKMMADDSGKQLVGESIDEALAFGREFRHIEHQIEQQESEQKKRWFFKLWQPMPDQTKPPQHAVSFNENSWWLSEHDNWHGFGQVDEKHIFLDPIKVTLLTPGVELNGEHTQFGIPAPLVSKYLMEKGIVDEKTGFYSMLFLFSIGVNKSKAMTLLTTLEQFKMDFDCNKKLNAFFPSLLRENPVYHNLTLQDLAQSMHTFLSKHQVSQLSMRAYDDLPEQILTPNAAYQHIVKANTIELDLDNVLGKTVLTMVAPYPPGIPIIMPGERLSTKHQPIIDYLKLLEAFDNAFPGFENEVHGTQVRLIKGKRRYYISCLNEG